MHMGNGIRFVHHFNTCGTQNNYKFPISES